MKKIHQQMPVEGRKYWKIPIPQEYKEWLETQELELIDVDVAFELRVNSPIVVTPKCHDYTGDIEKFDEHVKKVKM